MTFQIVLVDDNGCFGLVHDGPGYPKIIADKWTPLLMAFRHHVAQKKGCQKPPAFRSLSFDDFSGTCQQ